MHGTYRDIADHIKARNVAFLGVIREPAASTTTIGGNSVRCGMDARVVCLILKLSAPNVMRHVRVDRLLTSKLNLQARCLPLGPLSY